MQKLSLLVIFLIAYNVQVIKAQVSGNNPVTVTYKTVDTVKLNLKVYYPPNYNRNLKYPTIVFFFGGGWSKRHMDQFIPQAQYLIKYGMIAILADYRVREINKTTPFDAVRDAKSAIRYIKLNQSNLGVDTTKLVAAGGSAGGHLAAACDLTNLDEASENLKVSSKPKALILFNPLLYLPASRIGARYAEISPYHNIVRHAAPTLIFSGTADKEVSAESLKDYKNRMMELGNRCELYLYDDQVHGFYIYNQVGNNKYFDDTMTKTVSFLRSLEIIATETQSN